MKYERTLVCHSKLDLESSGPMQSIEEFFRLKVEHIERMEVKMSKVMIILKSLKNQVNKGENSLTK